jgi:hypothetical protein
MAKKDELNNMNETAAELKKLFKELGGLVNELNSKLADSADLTGKVAENTRKTTKNKKDSGSLSKEFMDSEKNRENLQKRVLNMNSEQLKFLRESLKTGKGLNREKLKELGLDANIGKLAGAAAKTKMEHLGISRQLIFLKETEIKLQKTANRLVDGLIQGFLKADEETAKMGKNLNLSRAEAASLKMEFAKVAVASGDVAINSTRLAEANADLNSQLGTAVVFSGEMLKTTSKLTKLVGLSAEAAGSLAFQAQRSGQSVREVEENALAASYELQQGAGVALNLKDVLEASGKVSGQLRAQLGANPEEIAKAVTKAKLLGAELEDLAAAGKQLLDFESSIESELEAELLTGKQLNLERARAAALAGDQVTLADELAKNMGTFSDFTKMNTLQQDALAKSMGMSTDALSDMLFKQETMGMNAQQLRAQGKDELADKLEQVSAQEKMNLLAEKFQGIMGDLATAFTPLLDTVAGIATYFASMPGVIGAIVSVMATLLVMQKALAIRSLIVATAKIFGENAKFGPGGIAIALGTIAAMGAAVGAARATNMAQGGIVKPKAGGTIARIGEAGQPEAVIPLNKARQMGFGGGGGAPQPIIINNTFDAFAASNGNGRKGLGGAQEMQASPTFA